MLEDLAVAFNAHALGMGNLHTGSVGPPSVLSGAEARCLRAWLVTHTMPPCCVGPEMFGQLVRHQAFHFSSTASAHADMHDHASKLTHAVCKATPTLLKALLMLLLPVAFQFSAVSVLLPTQIR